MSIEQIARDFGIHQTTLNLWLRAADVDEGPGLTALPDVLRENRELKRRNRLLEQENEVLRRAGGLRGTGIVTGKRLYPPVKALATAGASAGYELQIAVQELCEASELAAQLEEGEVSEATAHAAFDAIGDEPYRTVLGIGTAFNVGRITIVDAACYEAIGRAFNEFAKLRDGISGIGSRGTCSSSRPRPLPGS